MSAKCGLICTYLFGHAQRKKSISNISINDFAVQTGLKITVEDIARIDEAVRNAGYRILEGKGATWYGVAAGMARIARAIVEDDRSVLTCCAPLSKVEDVEDITLSLPHTISAGGIITSLYPSLDKSEQAALGKSAHIKSGFKRHQLLVETATPIFIMTS